MNLDSIFESIYQATIKQAALAKKAQMTPAMAETLPVKLFYLGYSDARGNLPINQELNEHKEYSRGFAAGEEANKDILGGPYNTGWEEWKKAMQAKTIEQDTAKTTPAVPPVSAADPIGLPSVINFGKPINLNPLQNSRKTAQVNNETTLEQIRTDFRNYFKDIDAKFNNIFRADPQIKAQFLLGRKAKDNKELEMVTNAYAQSCQILNKIRTGLVDGSVPTNLLITPEASMTIFKIPEVKAKMKDLMETTRRMDLVEKLKNIYKS
jgi:hypothetical protein